MEIRPAGKLKLGTWSHERAAKAEAEKAHEAAIQDPLNEASTAPEPSTGRKTRRAKSK